MPYPKITRRCNECGEPEPNHTKDCKLGVLQKIAAPKYISFWMRRKRG